jgi:transposase
MTDTSPPVKDQRNPHDDQTFAALVGLDWADQKHDVVLRAAGENKNEHLVLDHTPEGIDRWACGLRDRFGGRPVAVCFEQNRGAIAYALLKYEFLVLFPLPPARLARYRESLHTSGAKDDPTDAALLLDYLARHRDQIRTWRPDAPETRELRLLAEARRRAVDQRTRLGNQLTSVLKQYFPQALLLISDDVTAPLTCDLLSKWPTLAAIQKAAPSTLRKFYYAHSCRIERRIEERLAVVKNAIPLTNDSAVIEANQLDVQCLVGQLRALHKAIQRFDQRIRELMDQHPDAALFRALPGAGDVLAPRLLVAFGTDRERFESANQVQALAGVAPVTKRSGKRCTVQRRWACPKFMLQTFHEFAHWSRAKSTWAGAFYRQQRAAGKGHHAALRTLAFKWVRILFRCWKTNEPYCEQRYLAALQKRNAPLLAFLEPANACG